MGVDTADSLPGQPHELGDEPLCAAERHDNSVMAESRKVFPNGQANRPVGMVLESTQTLVLLYAWFVQSNVLHGQCSKRFIRTLGSGDFISCKHGSNVSPKGHYPYAGRRDLVVVAFVGTEHGICHGNIHPPRQ